MSTVITILKDFLSKEDVDNSLSYVKSRSDLVLEDWTYNSEVLFNDITLNKLLDKYRAKVEEVLSSELTSKYTFYRYSTAEKENFLPRHVDRMVCQYTVSINLGFSGSKPWPLYIKNTNGAIIEAILYPGDAVLYSGHVLEHWRDELLEGNNYQLCLHYVDKNSPFNRLEWNEKC